VGCGERVERGRAAAELIRLVPVPASGGGVDVVVDLASKAFGRGAWVHARRSCVTAAERSGLARSARRALALPAGEIERRIAAAAERRLVGLVGAAACSGRAVIGKTAVEESLARGAAAAVLVAKDAAVCGGPIGRGAAAGLAVCWGTKDVLGATVQRQQVAVIALLDEGIASAVRRAAALAETFGPQPERAVEQVQ